jgi:hypothetical protein
MSSLYFELMTAYLRLEFYSLDTLTFPLKYRGSYGSVYYVKFSVSSLESVDNIELQIQHEPHSFWPI